jgi:hypothetical protein
MCQSQCKFSADVSAGMRLPTFCQVVRRVVAFTQGEGGPFLARGIISERSSPSRVRYAAQNAPLTAVATWLRSTASLSLRCSRPEPTQRRSLNKTEMYPFSADRNTVVRCDNLPRTVGLHPNIGETVAIFVRFTFGQALFVIRASDHDCAAVRSNLKI